MTIHPEKLPLIHALADGELDVANTLAIEAHLDDCRACRDEYERIEALRGLIGAARGADRAPEELRARIEDLIAAEAGPAEPAHSASPARTGIAGHVLSRRWASGALSGALAASLALAVAVPQLTRSGTEDQLIQSHVRALLVDHVVDVQTSNRHVVKPWFNGKIDFAPPVPELADRGFPLVGGRLDYVEGRAVAAIVYRRRLHTINLFVRPVSGLSPLAFHDHRNGFSIIRWSEGGLEYWAVSDLGSDELGQFEQAFRAGAAR